MKSLSELRAERHMTQRDLAKELHLTPAAIGMYETGRRTPPLQTAILIARYFDTHVENISFSNNTSEGDS